MNGVLQQGAEEQKGETARLVRCASHCSASRLLFARVIAVGDQSCLW